MGDHGGVSTTPEHPTGSPQRSKPVISKSAAKRANASVRGMILSLAACMVAFFAVMAMNPYKDADTYQRDVDVTQIAQQAAGPADFTPLAPSLPDGWSANHARWNQNSTGGVPNWQVGYVTGSTHYIELTQTTAANPTWIAQKTEQAPVTGKRAIGGQKWQLRDNPEGKTSMILQLDGTTVVLTGKADFDEFDKLGAAVVTALKATP